MYIKPNNIIIIIIIIIIQYILIINNFKNKKIEKIKMQHKNSDSAMNEESDVKNEYKIFEFERIYYKKKNDDYETGINDESGNDDDDDEWETDDDDEDDDDVDEYEGNIQMEDDAQNDENLIEQLPNALVVHLNEQNEQIELELENNENYNERNILNGGRFAFINNGLRNRQLISSLLNAFNTKNKFTQTIPIKRSGHRAVCDVNNLYMWGGYCPKNEAPKNMNNPLCPLLPEMWRFNFSSRQWHLLKTKGDAPRRNVCSQCAILNGSFIILYGGTGYPFGEFLSNKIYVFNIKTLEWTKYDTIGDKLLPLYGCSMILVKNYLYILFGTNGAKYCSNVYRVDVTDWRVVKLFDSLEIINSSMYMIKEDYYSSRYPDNFLEGRYRQETILYDNKIFAFGGGNHLGETKSLTQLPAFCLINNEWLFIQTLPDINSKSNFSFCYFLKL
jgi:hypothetical protein